MPHSNGSLVQCYFCPTNPMRTDNLKAHCAAVHPSATLVTKEVTPCKYRFHMVEGYDSRVIATRPESPYSVGHCFACHRFVQPSHGRSIKDTMLAHVCPSFKERPKRAGSATKPVAGAGTTAPTEDCFRLTEDAMWQICKDTHHTIHMAEEGEDDIECSTLKGRGEVFVREMCDTVNSLKKRLTVAEAAQKAAPVVSNESGLTEEKMGLILRRGGAALRSVASTVTEQLKTSRDSESVPGEDYFYAVAGVLNKALGDAASATKEEAAMREENMVLRGQLGDLQRMYNLAQSNFVDSEAEKYELQKEVARLRKLVPSE